MALRATTAWPPYVALLPCSCRQKTPFLLQGIIHAGGQEPVRWHSESAAVVNYDGGTLACAAGTALYDDEGRRALRKNPRFLGPHSMLPPATSTLSLSPKSP
jgi:hypothetical protein